MAEFKPITLGAILDKEEVQIEADYPNGVAEVASKKKQSRFVPCEAGKPDMTLGELMDLKEDRMESDRIPHKDSTRGYTTISALGMKPDVGASPPEHVVDDYATENWQRFLGEKAQTPLHEELRAIEPHLRPGQKAELRKRIEGFKRSTHEKAA